MASATFAGSGACIALLAAASNARADVLNFTVDLDGAQANQCAGTGSSGFGSGTLTLNTDTSEVNFNITVQALSGTETASHVHGAAAQCDNAGVLFTLPSGSPKVGSVVLSPGEVQDMIDGLHYVNVHTDLHPSGEIRGQVLPVPPTIAFGLPFAPLGAASLSLDPAGGQLTVSNIGSSGEDGVSIDVGEVEGWMTEVDFGRAGFLSPGSKATYRGKPGIGHPRWTTSIEETGGGSAQVFVTFDTPGLFVERVDLYLGPDLVDSTEFQTDPGGALVVGNIGSSGKDGVRCGVNYGWWGHCNGWCAASVIETPAPTPLTIFGGSPVLADRIVIFADDDPTPFFDVTMTFANVGPTGVVFKGKKILQNFAAAGATGDAHIRGVADLNGDGRPDIVVSNIGSSGLDGVTVANSDANAGNLVRHRGAHVVMNSQDPTIPGAFLRFSVFGTTVGSTIPVAIDDTVFTYMGGDVASLSQNLSALGTNQVDVFAYLGGAFTGTSTTLLASNIGTVTSTSGLAPKITDFGLSRSLPDNGGDQDGVRMCFDGPVTLALNDGTPPVLCDCLHLIANGGTETIDEIEAVRIHSLEFPELLLYYFQQHGTMLMNGLATQTAGVSVRGWDPVKKELIVSNIGSSGEDGVSIGLGEGEGWESQLTIFGDGAVPPNTTLDLTLVPVSDAPEPTCRLSHHASGGAGGSIWLNGLPPTTGNVTLRGYTDDVMVHATTIAAPFPDPLFVAPMSANPAGKRKYAEVLLAERKAELDESENESGGGGGGGDRVVVRFQLSDTTSDVTLAGTNVGGLDYFEIIYEDPSLSVTDPLYAGGLITGTTPSPQTREHILLARQVGVNWGNEHEATGDARYVLQRNESDLQFLRMHVGSDGGGAIRISPQLLGLQNAIQMESRKFQVLATSSVNEGNNENWNFEGHAAIEITPGSTDIGNISMDAVGGQRRVSVGPIRWMAPESIHSRVYNGATLVGEVSGLPPGVVATAVVPQTPGTYAFELLVGTPLSSTTPTGVRHTIVWDTPRDIDLPGVGLVLGDRLEVDMTGTPAEGAALDFDIETIEFEVTSSAGEVSIDLAEETVVWAETCPADTNVSNTVDIVDLLALLAAWGPCPTPCPPHCPADVNNDCVVDIVDLLAVLASWGPCP